MNKIAFVKRGNLLSVKINRNFHTAINNRTLNLARNINPMKMNRYLIVFLTLFAVSIQSCDEAQQGSDQKESKENQKPENDTGEEPEAANTSEFVIPGSVHIGELFKKAGLQYVPNVANDPANASSYNSKTEKLLNYGVYSADFTYAALNSQSNEAASYLNVLKTLGEEIGFAEVYADEEFLKRFESELEDEEKVVELMREIQERTDAFVDDNVVSSEALVIFTGAWIEGMYLGAKAANLSDREEISQRLLEQMTMLDNMLVGLNDLSRRVENLQPLVNDLEQLNMFFLSLPEVKESDRIRDVKINLADLKKIADYVTAIRTSITE